jgi:hypothetical protein
MDRADSPHHEGCKVRDVNLGRYVRDGCVDDKPDEGEGIAKDDEWRTEAGKVREEGQHQEHNRTGNIGSDCVEVRLDRVVLQASDDLRKEESNGLKGDAEADLNRKEAVCRRIREDFQAVSQVELFGDNRTGINLDPVESKRLLFLVQELGLGCAPGKIPQSKEGEREGAGSFDDEQIAPVIDRGVDVEHAEGQETGEGICDVGGSVEDGETPRKLPSPVERGQVVDDGWEEGRLGHPEEPPQGKDPGEVLRCGGEEGETPERDHHDRQRPRRAETLGKHCEWRGEDDIGHEKNRNYKIVLIPFETKVCFETLAVSCVEGGSRLTFAQAVGLRISQVPLVECIEQI